jgi:2-methylaconitate cis-trans-isomerase PrpF
MDGIQGVAEPPPFAHLIDEDGLIAMPVTWYRGGTSKVFFVERAHVADLSTDQMHRWIRGVFGSPDRRQIDGVGGADQVTSKFAILGPPTRPDAHIDYSFFQVGIDSDIVATDLNCGNVSAAVALYAVDRHYVAGTDGQVEVRIDNTNDGKLFYATLELRHGKAVTSGDFSCEGVPGSGAPIGLDFREAIGGRTGTLFPTGNLRDRFEVPGYGEIEVSVLDIANLIVFAPAAAFGLHGNEDPVLLQNTPGLVDSVEWLRGAVAQKLGLATSPGEARVQSPGTPFVSLVSGPQDWTTFGYNVVRKAEECDMTGRGFTVQAFTKAYWGTGSVCTGVAASVTGTVVNDLVRPSAARSGRIRIAHPSGTIDVDIDVGQRAEGTFEVRRASLLRTARKLMVGTTFVPLDRVMINSEY